ncbi:putative nucleotide-sugar transporter [Helianthus debilis subsp. tardiflorus]
MKKNNDTLYWQNVQLYTQRRVWEWAVVGHLFNGYTITPWLVVLNICFTGLLVSWLMTYAGNIIKVVLFMTCIFFLSLSSSLLYMA